MNVVESTAVCATPLPVEPGGNAKNDAGAVPAGVLAGFGDVLLLLLATAGQAGPIPGGEAPGGRVVESVSLLAHGVLHTGPSGGPSGQVVPAEGATALEWATHAGASGMSAVSGMDVIAAGVGETGGDRPPVAVAAGERGVHGEPKPAGRPVAPGEAGAVFPGFGTEGDVETATAGGPAASDDRALFAEPLVQAGVAGAEAAADSTSGVEAGRTAGSEAKPMAASRPVHGEPVTSAEQVAEPAAPAMPRQTAAAGDAVTEAATRTVEEEPRPGGEDGAAVEGASSVKAKKDALHESAGGESGVEAVRRVSEPSVPAAEARPVAAGKDAVPMADENRSGGREARAVGTAEIAREIVQHGRMLKYPERTEVEIRLKPEWMGRVTLRVASQEGRVSARFIVTESAVKAEIESRLGELRHEMAEQDLNIGEISVSLDGGRQVTSHGGWTPEGGRPGGEWTTDSRFSTEAEPDATGPMERWAYPRSTGTLDVMA